MNPASAQHRVQLTKTTALVVAGVLVVVGIAEVVGLHATLDEAIAALTA